MVVTVAPESRATSADAWKTDTPELHELPSGNSALLMRASLMNLMRAGELPKTLVDVAIQAVQGELPDEVAELATFLDFMVAAAFVEPIVVWDGEPGEGELHVSQLSDADRNYVLRYLQWGISVHTVPSSVENAAAQEAA